MSEPTAALTHALSVDIGGTFTDFSLLDMHTHEVRVHKVLTDPQEPAQALMYGTSELLQAAGLGFDRLLVLVHSTTLATNAIIERRGATVGLLTTKGFRDILEMGREQIYDMHDLHARVPEPLVPRYLRAEIAERLSRDGTVLQRPAPAAITAVVQALLAQGVEALAVCLLHAYKNPLHERLLQEQIQAQFPDLTLSLSSEVAPIINEYERTSTTVADAYIKPPVWRYLHRLEDDLAAANYAGKLLVMHSAGGVMDSDMACRYPVRMLESGPAAGALAASFYSQLLGLPELISLDMGGTTAKTCVIEGGRPTVTNSIEVARVHRFKKGSGLPIVMPVLDLIEIGAGGGSIAWVDNLGLLKVGPRSAGANPGPACYGLGGSEPTVTDANVVLGYLNPEYFLGGRMILDTDAAQRAVSHLADALGMRQSVAAWGIYSVVTENMAAASRIHIISRNKDPRHYAMVAFGGAGPAHACEVARILGVRRVIAPLAAGVLSAIGALTAPLSFEAVRSLPGLLQAVDWPGVNAVYADMETWGRARLQEAGIPASQVECVRSADMRLVGQIHEINVPIPAGALAPAQTESIATQFHTIYQGLYSRKNLSIPIEVQNWRLLVKGPQPPVRLREVPVTTQGDPRVALKGTRRAYFRPAGGYLDCPVYDRYQLPPGCNLHGPAIIEEQESTAVLGPHDRASIDRWLNLIVDVG
jgi:N-methylhydantoinase A/oxoprolinase/acetone carboxylase beta subunit